MNYQKELDKITEDIKKTNKKPTLFLHSCCAPCSSYVLMYLKEYFDITVFYYNPNITDAAEYEKRAEEQQRFIKEAEINCGLLKGEWEKEKFDLIAKGREEEKEGGERCFACYALRLFETAKKASEGGFDYFCTTLSISPHKNAEKLNEIGKKAEEKYKIKYLPSDFKKKNGFKISTQLSEKYGLYRQDYCGCEYSKRR